MGRARHWIGTIGALGLGLALAARAEAFSGVVSYDGGLGPVNGQKPLCVCVYTDADLTNGLGCLILRRNAAAYALNNLGNRDYYLIAFLDLHINERLDPDEPYEIFQRRAALPADPVGGRSGRDDVDFAFGDENLAATPTPSPTAAPSAAGDCDGNDVVSVDELVRAVAIALESVALSTCPAADLDGDGAVRIDELIAALNLALG